MVLQIAPKRNPFTGLPVPYGNSRPPLRHLPAREQVDPAGPGGGFTCHASRALLRMPTQTWTEAQIAPTCSISSRFHYAKHMEPAAHTPTHVNTQSFINRHVYVWLERILTAIHCWFKEAFFHQLCLQVSLWQHILRPGPESVWISQLISFVGIV